MALVTGAGRGIGRAVALGLAADGHPVALTARSRHEIEDVAAEIRGAGGRATAFPADVTDPESVVALADSVLRALGPPLILVNNAGAAASHKFLGHPDALWHSMLAVNLTGPYLVTKALAPGLLDAGWGRVVNIGSIASLRGARYIAAYTAAKHGLLGLTRALAAEWIDKGITVNLVAPGYVDTAMTAATVENIVARTAMDRGAATAAVEGMSPQRRLVAPAEIVPIVRMLVAEEAASVTGAVIPVDGGASALAATGS